MADETGKMADIEPARGGFVGDTNDLGSDTFYGELDKGDGSPSELVEDPVGGEGEVEEVEQAVEEALEGDEEGEEGAFPPEADKRVEKTDAAQGGVVRVGDVNVPRDAKVSVTVDGKEEVTTLQELRNNYSGKTNWQRQYTQLGEERKQVRQEKEEVYLERARNRESQEAFERRYAGIKQAFQGGKVEDIMNAIVHETGTDPIKFWNDFDAQMSKFYGEYNRLPDSEKKIIAERRANTLLNNQIKQRREEELKQAEIQERTQFVSKVCEEYQVENADVQRAWAELDYFAKMGKLDPKTVEGIKALEPQEQYRYAARWAAQGKVNQQLISALQSEAADLDPETQQTIARNIADVFTVERAKGATAKDFRDAVKVARRKLKPSEEKVEQKTKDREPVSSLGDKVSTRHKRPTAPNEEDLYSRDGFEDAIEGVWGASFDT